MLRQVRGKVEAESRLFFWFPSFPHLSLSRSNKLMLFKRLFITQPALFAIPTINSFRYDFLTCTSPCPCHYPRTRIIHIKKEKKFSAGFRSFVHFPSLSTWPNIHSVAQGGAASAAHSSSFRNGRHIYCLSIWSPFSAIFLTSSSSHSPSSTMDY